MNKILLLFLMLTICFSSKSQTIEQIALDFYAEKVLPKKKHLIVSYDGRIQPIDSNYHETAKYIISQFYWCKRDPRGENNDSIKKTFEDYKVVVTSLENTQSFKKPAANLQLKVPKNIKKKNQLKYKNIGGSTISSKLKSVSRLIFPIKYNLAIESAVAFEGNFYVLLNVTKNDHEYGKQYFIKLTEDKNVEDWCEVGWIQ